ncbi:MAG: hypothetical protein KAH18_07490 [Psychromonas sp.]|nr:hypothetical protein [Psychromonas sp.]
MKKAIFNVAKLIVLLGILSVIGCVPPRHVKGPHIVVPPGKAVIYFFRPDAYSGRSIKFSVLDMQGKTVGYLGKGGDSFSTVVVPGIHKYRSRKGSLPDVLLTAESGKIYYVKGSVNMGFVVGRPILKEVSLSEVQKKFITY